MDRINFQSFFIYHISKRLIKTLVWFDFDFLTFLLQDHNLEEQDTDDEEEEEIEISEQQHNQISDEDDEEDEEDYHDYRAGDLSILLITIRTPS